MESHNFILKDIKRFVKNCPQSDDTAMVNSAFHGFKSGPLITPADIKKLKEVLLYLKEDMEQHQLSVKSCFNMMTAAEEIFSNIALYAYDSKENAIITIKTSLVKDIYYITFIDNGKKYNPLEKPAPDISTDLKSKHIGGLGIFLAKKLSDMQSYTYRNKQNILKLGINRNKA